MPSNRKSARRSASPPTNPTPDFSRAGWTPHRLAEWARWAEAEATYREQGAWTAHVRAVGSLSALAEAAERDTRRLEREGAALTDRQRLAALRSEAESDGSWVAAAKLAALEASSAEAGPAGATLADVVDELGALPAPELEAVVLQLQAKLAQATG